MSAPAAEAPKELFIESLPAGFGGPARESSLAEHRTLATTVAPAVMQAMLTNSIPPLPGISGSAASGGAEGKFSQISNKDGVLLEGGSTVGTALTLIKATTTAACSLADFENFVCGQDTWEALYFVRVCDPEGKLIPEAKILHRVEGSGFRWDATGINVPAALAARIPSITEFWTHVALPWPLDDRDILTSERYVRVYLSPDNTWRVADGAPNPGEKECTLYTWLPFARDDAPPLPKLVRAINFGGMLVEPTAASTPAAPECNIRFVSLGDMKGSMPDWLQNMFASEAASLVVNFKKHFVERRLAESMLAPVVPTAAFRDAETGLIARLIDVPTSSGYTHTVKLSTGASLTVWTSTESHRVRVNVTVEPAGAATLLFAQSDGTDFSNGSKLLPKTILVSNVVRAAGPCKITIAFTNTGYTTKKIALAMQATDGDGAK